MNIELELKILDIQQETPDCKTYFLERPIDFNYTAGQYITLQIGYKWDVTRSYSLSSIPSEQHLGITIKRVENGLYSRWALDHLKIGDTLKVIGKFGEFTIKNPQHPHLLFAAGSGIVPIYALIKELIQKSPEALIHLHYSAPTPERCIFYHQLNQLQLNHPNLVISYYFSQIKNEKPQRLNNFEIPKIIESRHPDTEMYICGPIDYMDVIQINALTYGMDKTKIHTEDYLSYYEDGFEGEERAIPVDTNEYQVTIHLKGESKTFQVQYPKSILETGLEQGLKLPYSCFSGQCGQCVAHKKSGEVFMIYNQVLTKSEIQQGLILTCQGFPVGGPVELEY